VSWRSSAADREGKGVGQLPPARLARLTPALLGLPDPDRLLPSCGIVPVPEDQLPVRAARRRGLRAQGPLAARRRRGLGQHHLPCLRRPARARPTRWTPSSTRPGTSCATATRATTRRPGIPQVLARVDAGRPVHRRRRARDPPPDVRALLRQGARRPRPPRLPGAVRGALHPGDDHARRREDVEVARQRRLAASIVERYGADTARSYILFIGPARPGRRLVG
jgi:hypothetical protein